MLFQRPLSELDITQDEFVYWQAYLGMHPPDEAEIKRTAMLMATITNMSGRSLPKGKMVEAADFIGSNKEQTAEEQIAFLKAVGE